MSTSNKTPASDHSHGGPSNSQQDATKPALIALGRCPGGARQYAPQPVSGGGCELTATIRTSHQKKEKERRLRPVISLTATAMVWRQAAGGRWSSLRPALSRLRG